MTSVLDEVSPAAVVPQLRRQVSLLDREERAARWEARACAGMTPKDADRVFFTRPGERRALALCGGCVARVQCALRALSEDARSDYLPEGTVGGLTATDRVRILYPTIRPRFRHERPAV